MIQMIDIEDNGPASAADDLDNFTDFNATQVCDLSSFCVSENFMFVFLSDLNKGREDDIEDGDNEVRCSAVGLYKR